MESLGVSVAEVWSFVKAYWIVPGGMIALYYYGWFHFNTPDYALEQKTALAETAIERGRLLSLAPPKFTTSRSRYNRYALRYILILEAAFLAFVFLTGLISTAGKIASISLPDLAGENLEYRALWALFALTGLLSSFPVFKDVDDWLLKKLHQAALIPDDARFMADRLYEAPFEASKQVAEEVKQTLRMRDTVRVAAGKAKGTLELRLLRMLWLRNQLRKTTSGEKYAKFMLKIERDISDVFNISKAMQDDINAYFKDQERLVNESVIQIDHYISDNMADASIAALKQRREILQAKCDALYYRLCLITALMVFATESKVDTTSSTLRGIGFNVDVIPRPVVDWDAIFRIAASIFVVTLGFRAAFAVLFHFLGIDLPGFGDRKLILTHVLNETVSYAVMMIIAVRAKKYWSRPGTREQSARAEPIWVALLSYACVVVQFAALEFYLTRSLSLAALLYPLNVGAAGYFVALYIDRSVLKQPVSRRLIAWQALSQFLASLIAIGLTPAPQGVTLGQWLSVATLGGIHSAIIAIMLGLMFQHFYRRTMAGETSAALGPRAASAAFGDLRVEPRELSPESDDDANALEGPRRYSPEREGERRETPPTPGGGYAGSPTVGASAIPISR